MRAIQSRQAEGLPATSPDRCGPAVRVLQLPPTRRNRRRGRLACASGHAQKCPRCHPDQVRTRLGTTSRAVASINKTVLDLAQFAFDLLRTAVGVQQCKRQFLSKRPAWPFQPISRFLPITEHLGCEIVNSIDAGETVRSRRAEASGSDMFPLQRPLRNTKNAEQNRTINPQEPAYRVQLFRRKALANCANGAYRGRRIDRFPRHLSIIIRQMSQERATRSACSRRRKRNGSVRRRRGRYPALH